MNFPTAYVFAKAGHPIARGSWADEFDDNPTRWVTFEGGLWFDNDANGKRLINLSPADLFGDDWMLPPGCTSAAAVAERADFPRGSLAPSEPQFCVDSPPCKVA